MNTTGSKKWPNGSTTNIPCDFIVRIEGSLREPTTLVERLTVAVLQRESPIPLHLLLERVADELYQQELDDGAWVLDLGMFGSGLFIPDLAREIRAGNGILWQITRKR